MNVRFALAVVLLATGCTVGRKPDEVPPPRDAGQVGWATWYGPGFAGRPTANGERFDPEGLTAAHRTLPFGTRLAVTNLENGRDVAVRVNDRGPFGGRAILDLSQAAARVLKMIERGRVKVRIRRIR